MARAKMKGVPKDELVLAEALANVEKCRVGFRVAGVGIDDFGEPFADRRVCVIGAYRLGKRSGHQMQSFTDETGFDYVNTYNGNDSDSSLWGESVDDIGETLGYAFRVAMTEIK